MSDLFNVDVRGVDLIPVNNLPAADLQGVEGIKVLVGTFCEGFITYEKVIEDGKITVSDAPALLGFAMTLPSLFTNISNVPGETNSLTDAEIAEVVAVVDNYTVGQYATRIKGVIKQLLVTLQTIAAFKA